MSLRFHLPGALALVTFAACASPREPAREDAKVAGNATAATALFPAPKRALEFTLPAATILDSAQLLDAFSATTGWTVLLRGDEKWAEWSTGVTVEQAHRVPPADVYTFVEGILVQHGCVLSIVSATEPRLLALHWTEQPRAASLLQRARLVDEADLAGWRAHPAQLVRVLVTVEREETRELVQRGDSPLGQDSLQELIQLAGTRVVVVAGLAPWVAERCELLHRLDRQLAAAAAPIEPR